MLLFKNAFKQGFALAKPSLSLSVFSKSAMGLFPSIYENSVMQHTTLYYTPSAGFHLPSAAAKSKLFAKKYSSGRPKSGKRGKFSRKSAVRTLIRAHRQANHNGLLARIRIVTNNPFFTTMTHHDRLVLAMIVSLSANLPVVAICCEINQKIISSKGNSYNLYAQFCVTL